jgi:hypothetical protein
MLHACVQRFDVTGNLVKIFGILKNLNTASGVHAFSTAAAGLPRLHEAVMMQ